MAAPMELARDKSLKAQARSVAFWLWSHADGFDVSAKLIARELGIGVDTADSALDKLESALWLIRQPIVTAVGKTPWAYRFHLQRERRFTDDERSRWCAPIVKGAGKPEPVVPVSVEPLTGEGYGKFQPDGYGKSEPKEVHGEVQDNNHLRINGGGETADQLLGSLRVGSRFGGIPFMRYLALFPGVEANVLPFTAMKVGSTVDDLIALLEGQDVRDIAAWNELVHDPGLVEQVL